MSASLRLRLSLHPEQVAAERAYPDDLGDSVTVRYRNHATGSGREIVQGLQRGIERLRFSTTSDGPAKRTPFRMPLSRSPTANS